MAYHPIVIGGDAVQEDDAPQFLQAGEVVAVWRAFLEQRFEVGHGRMCQDVMTMLDDGISVMMCGGQDVVLPARFTASR